MREFNHAERFRFNRQANRASGLFFQLFEKGGQFDQLFNTDFAEIGRVFKLFKPERHGGDAAFHVFRQESSQDPGAAFCVFQSFRLRPVGEIDIFFDAFTVEVAIREGIHCVAGQLAFLEFPGEAFYSISAGENFLDHGFRQPQTGGQGGA